jgi:hypothetical protein
MGVDLQFIIIKLIYWYNKKQKKVLEIPYPKYHYGMNVHCMSVIDFYSYIIVNISREHIVSVCCLFYSWNLNFTFFGYLNNILLFFKTTWTQIC